MIKCCFTSEGTVAHTFTFFFTGLHAFFHTLSNAIRFSTVAPSAAKGPGKPQSRAPWESTYGIFILPRPIIKKKSILKANFNTLTVTLTAQTVRQPRATTTTSPVMASCHTPAPPLRRRSGCQRTAGGGGGVNGFAPGACALARLGASAVAEAAVEVTAVEGGSGELLLPSSAAISGCREGDALPPRGLCCCRPGGCVALPSLGPGYAPARAMAGPHSRGAGGALTKAGQCGPSFGPLARDPNLYFGIQTSTPNARPEFVGQTRHGASRGDKTKLGKKNARLPVNVGAGV